MKHILHNPVFNALLSGDKQLSFGTATAKFFDEEVSPFVGFEDDNTNGFKELQELLPEGRRILYANPVPIVIPNGWQILHDIPGLQFVYEGTGHTNKEFTEVIPLQKMHIEQMVDLATLTKPGPFGIGTINFGYYHGI